MSALWIHSCQVAFVTLPLRVVVATLVLSVPAGCSTPPPTGQLKTVPVTGVVLLNGQPLPDATLSFISHDGQITSRGVTDNKGEFVLSTYGHGDGAPVGSYKILVSLDEFDVSPDGRPIPKAKKRTGPPVPVRFSRPGESPLTAEVTSSGPNHFSLPLK